VKSKDAKAGLPKVAIGMPIRYTGKGAGVSKEARGPQAGDGPQVRRQRVDELPREPARPLQRDARGQGREVLPQPEERGGVQMNEKPRVKLLGEDGNVFNVIGLVSRALKARRPAGGGGRVQAPPRSCPRVTTRCSGWCWSTWRWRRRATA